VQNLEFKAVAECFDSQLIVGRVKSEIATANVGFRKGKSVATLGWSRGGRATRVPPAALLKLAGTHRANP
jgi:hypothetical protein